MILKGYIIIYFYLIFLIFVSYILNKKFKVELMLTRKFVHIMVSFIWILTYIYFGASIHILIPPLTFIILNYISYRKNLFKGIEQNNSLGTVYYPVSVFIMALITYYKSDFILAFGIGFLCMGLGDGLAPLIAYYLKSRKLINDKTLTGTITVFIVSFVIVLSFISYFELNIHIIKVLIIATAAALMELIGVDGLDNLYLPLGVSVVTYLLGVM